MCKKKTKRISRAEVYIGNRETVCYLSKNVIFISIRYSGDQKINKLYFACFIDMSINRHLSNIFF